MRIGVEHEYCLWAGDDRQDFRRLIDLVAGGLATLDPGDPRARRLPSGVALTADGWEAELASPPLPLSGGAPARIDDLLRSERTELRRALDPLGTSGLTGFSTHLNLTVPDDLTVDLGRRFVQHAALPLAGVTEPPTSSGVFVRPRRGRLEVGGEYVEGERLVAALVFMAGAVSGLMHHAEPRSAVPVAATASREKFGWFVGPELLDPGTIARTWAWVRPWVEDLDLDPSLVESVLDRPHPGDACTFDEASDAPTATGATAPRQRPSGVCARTEWLTWQHVVWTFTDGRGSSCRAVVPAEGETDFLVALDAGVHDELVARLLRPTLRRRRLLVHRDLDQITGQISWWHDVRPGALVPAERDAEGSVPRISRRAARRDLRLGGTAVPTYPSAARRPRQSVQP